MKAAPIPMMSIIWDIERRGPMRITLLLLPDFMSLSTANTESAPRVYKTFVHCLILKS